MMTQQIVGERTRLDQHALVTAGLDASLDNWDVWFGCTQEARRPVDIGTWGADGFDTVNETVWQVLSQIARNVERKP